MASMKMLSHKPGSERVAATTSFMSTGVGSSSSEMTLRPEISTNYYFSFRTMLKPKKVFSFWSKNRKGSIPRFGKIPITMKGNFR